MEKGVYVGWGSKRVESNKADWMICTFRVSQWIGFKLESKTILNITVILFNKM